MSASTDSFAALNSSTERRFYPRTAPSGPVYVALGGKNLSMILNLGENGLLVSTPSELNINSVYRVSLRLEGLPKPIDVQVRTVWTAELTRRAGIQFLDLSEFDREQIRKWQALEDLNGKAASSERERLAAEPIIEPPAPKAMVQPRRTPPPPPPPQPIPAYLAPLPETEPLRNTHMDALVSRSAHRARVRPRKSPVAGLVAWTLFASLIALVAAFFVNPGLSEKFFGPGLSQKFIGHLKPTANQTQAPSLADDSAAAPSDNSPPTAGASEAAPNAADAGNAAPAIDTPQSTATNVPASPQLAPSVPASPSVSNPTPAPRHVALRTSSSPAWLARTTDARPSLPNSSASSSEPEQVASNITPSVLPNTIVPASAANQPLGQVRAPAAPPAPAPVARSAITGSISGTAASTSNSASATQPATSADVSPTTTRSTWSSGPPTSAGKTSFFHPFSSSAVVQMDPTPGPVAEVTPPRGIRSSYVPLPGERVLESPGVTMRVQRSVQVGDDHWAWRTHKKVVLGELTSRIDPQAPRVPAYGNITVQATIDKEGRVTKVKPLNGSYAFLASVSNAIRGWRYEPTYVDNKPVETQAQIELDFHPQSSRNRP
jgi:hypothetical protein